MPYRLEDFAEGCFYHVYNRGLLGQELFIENLYFEKFLKKLQSNLDDLKFSLHAYCLMPNHYHLLLQQGGNFSVTVMMNSLQGSYAKFFNKKMERKGSVFEGRFKVKLIDSDEYLLQVSKYIHLNPVRAKLVHDVMQYKWSSFKSYVSELKEPFVETRYLIGYFGKENYQGSYESFVKSDFHPEKYIVLAEEFIDGNI